MYPAYLQSYKEGKLKKTAQQLSDRLKSCDLCPRKCGVNRLEGEEGFCKTALKAKIYSFMAHHGEEPPVSGVNGSGTIFFSGCNMRCVYCQNHCFSQGGEGREIARQELAEIMLKLQDASCHNINLVTPTHVLPQILKALEIAVGEGLKIPLVYNTGGYEASETIKMLEGIVDIYLPDMRYADNQAALKYSAAPEYPSYNRQAVKEMHRQAGNAQINDKGIISRGMIIRHLVLPNNISGTDKIMRFVADNISRESYISLMSQYHPCFTAKEFPELSHRLSAQEYREAQEIMEKYGLHNGWSQDSGGMESYLGTRIKAL